MSDSILVVDDNHENLDVLSQLLITAGYAVHPANDGKTALKALRHLSADLILLDIRMPGMDGYAVCEELKKNPATHDIPVIFISALQEPLDKVKAFKVGGVDYVGKPFDQDEVLARVSTHLQLHRLQKLQRHYAEELKREVILKTAALRETHAALEKSLRVKHDFLMLMNHELRTPLNGILGMAHLLRDCAEQEREEYLDVVEQGGLQLLKLFENILQLTAQMGLPSLPKEQSASIQIEQVCADSLKMIARLVEAKKLSVDLKIEAPAYLEIPLGLPNLRQILANLLDNAVKFTPKEGAIGVEARYVQNEQHLSIAVWDTGPGIPFADRSRIFEPFVQLEPIMTRRHEGTGLGLALVRNLLTLHGGQIRVFEREGGGSLFRVYLAAKPVAG